MRRNIVLISVLIFFPIQCWSQNIPDIKTYEDCVPLTDYIDGHKDSTSEFELRQFLLAFSNANCINNVEFREYGNEVLFSLIDINPILFFQTLFNLTPNQITVLQAEINNPINDDINVVKKYETISDSNMPIELKTKALAFLKQSYESQKRMTKEWERVNNKKWEYH